MGVTPIYSIPFADPTNLVVDWPALSEDIAVAIEAALEGIPVMQKKVARFTSSGTWTVPAGVTYAIAHMLGGGAGSGGRTDTTNTVGGNGSASSVAFASGTVSAAGGIGTKEGGTGDGNWDVAGVNATANSGAPGGGLSGGNRGVLETTSGILYGVSIVAGAAVTAAASIAVTVGAGGTGSGATAKGGDGGSGYVFIEYFEPV
jgi:hypothetical protein